MDSKVTKMNNDREWHAEYERRKEQEGEQQPFFAYPPNMEVNRQLNWETKRYIQDPFLFRRISRLEVPSLFVYGEKDIRPSWPVEQVVNLMPKSRFERIEAAEHAIWLSKKAELKQILRRFVEDVIEINMRRSQ